AIEPLIRLRVLRDRCADVTSAQHGPAQIALVYIYPITSIANLNWRGPMNKKLFHALAVRRTVLSIGFALVFAMSNPKAEAALTFSGVAAGDASTTKVTLWTRAVDS